MRILVTGADGLIGAGVIEQLELYFDVYTTSRRNLFMRATNHIICDLYKENLDDKFLKLHLDVIVHCAAMIPDIGNSTIDILSFNKLIDEKIVMFCKENNTKLIFMSGTTLYDLTDNKVTEKSIIKPVSDYLQGKYDTELNILKSGIRYNIFRISSPYGAFQKNSTVLKKFIELACTGNDLSYWGSGERTQNFIHTDDIARAIVNSIRFNVNGIFNIASDSSISMKGLAELVATITNELFGKNIKILKASNADPQDNVRINIDIEKAKRELEWEPMVNLYNGAKRCIINTKKM